MVELGRQLGLIDEHADELFVARQVGQDSLDGDGLLEPLETEHAGLVDLGHPPGRDVLFEDVLAEGRSRGNRRRPLGRRLLFSAAASATGSAFGASASRAGPGDGSGSPAAAVSLIGSFGVFFLAVVDGDSSSPARVSESMASTSALGFDRVGSRISPASPSMSANASSTSGIHALAVRSRRWSSCRPLHPSRHQRGCRRRDRRS